MVMKGQKINDRYQIIRLIGEGGMANVYLAHDTILDRDVAVKILRGDLAGDEKFVKKFQREAISASSLNHPNIVELYDVGEDNGQYFIVMEYVDGKTLKSLVKKRGALTLPEVIDIMLQLTSAIAHAHDSYIIHNDKEFLKELLEEIKKISNELGLIINDKKTRIVKLSQQYKVLQINYSLSETGRIIKKINPKAITRERRKLKAYKRLLSKNRITINEIENIFKSWMSSNYKIMSKKQISNMYQLYYDLFERRITWKNHGKLRYLMELNLKT